MTPNESHPIPRLSFWLLSMNPSALFDTRPTYDQQPAALAFAETHTRDHLLAVAEGHQLSVWDLRASSKGGCVARVSPAGATNLSAVCGCGAGAVAVAGEERIVHVFDSKMWRVRARWPGALKFSIASLCSSPCAEGCRPLSPQPRHRTW